MSTALAQGNGLRVAAQRLAEAETALHAARQSHVDAWVMAASDKLHEAAIAYVAALDNMRRSTSALPHRIAEGDAAADHPAQLR